MTAYLLACFLCYLNSPVYLLPFSAHYISLGFFSSSHRIYLVPKRRTMSRPCFLGYTILLPIFLVLYYTSFPVRKNNGLRLLPTPDTAYCQFHYEISLGIRKYYIYILTHFIIFMNYFIHSIIPTTILHTILHSTHTHPCLPTYYIINYTFYVYGLKVYNIT